jgi:hypothetical protein
MIHQIKIECHLIFDSEISWILIELNLIWNSIHYYKTCPIPFTMHFSEHPPHIEWKGTQGGMDIG